ncbi:MAG: hypothetical protein CVU28_14360 [Betaproteobacteria bacterium HGW-Betaproteobacteria-21]|nr:MAG: hypothetical protein CVU28_14360 [Betaproteobacteria bacterium HGW-Betaproteobacteria-21]
MRDAICAGAANPVPATQAIGVMAVLETVVEAARRGSLLPLPLTGAESAAAECAAWPGGAGGAGGGAPGRAA